MSRKAPRPKPEGLIKPDPPPTPPKTNQLAKWILVELILKKKDD